MMSGMELMETIRKRRSVRKYRTDTVPEKDIEYVLEASSLAPSWGYKQCWRYIIVTDEALGKKITVRDYPDEAPASKERKEPKRDGKPEQVVELLHRAGDVDEDWLP